MAPLLSKSRSKKIILFFVLYYLFSMFFFRSQGLTHPDVITSANWSEVLIELALKGIFTLQTFYSASPFHFCIKCNQTLLLFRMWFISPLRVTFPPIKWLNAKGGGWHARTPQTRGRSVTVNKLRDALRLRCMQKKILSCNVHISGRVCFSAVHHDNMIPPERHSCFNDWLILSARG